MAVFRVARINDYTVMLQAECYELAYLFCSVLGFAGIAC